MAQHYSHRAGYSRTVLGLLMRHVSSLPPQELSVADVGAGTGKLTEELAALGLRPVCVEPNDEMRTEGARALAALGLTWKKGSAEETGLPARSADWLLMGSSFHWADPARALPEFHRVLREGGAFTAVWNPRDLQGQPLHERIEERIRALIPNLKRVSSGGAAYTEKMFSILTSTGHFEDVVLVEARHTVAMTKERYMGAWRSVNDIQVQAGDRWNDVLAAIEQEVSGLEVIEVPYRTRAYTARRV